jgi:hypothetical protein
VERIAIMAQRKRITPEPELPRSVHLLDAEVKQYLAIHPDLATVVPEAMRRLSLIFGPDTRFRLTVIHWFDNPGSNTLSLEAIVDLDPSEGLDRLDQFDQEWWLSQAPSVQTQMIVDYAFT